MFEDGEREDSEDEGGREKERERERENIIIFYIMQLYVLMSIRTCMAVVFDIHAQTATN